MFYIYNIFIIPDKYSKSTSWIFSSWQSLVLILISRWVFAIYENQIAIEGKNPVAFVSGLFGCFGRTGLAASHCLAAPAVLLMLSLLLATLLLPHSSAHTQSLLLTSQCPGCNFAKTRNALALLSASLCPLFRINMFLFLQAFSKKVTFRNHLKQINI